MTRVLVLDLWGTLVATPDASSHTIALDRVADRLGIETLVFRDVYDAKRQHRNTGLWTRDAGTQTGLASVYLERLVAQAFPALSTTLTPQDVREAAQHLLDDTRDALDISRLVPGVLDALDSARQRGSLVILCSDADPWTREALADTPLFPLLDGLVISAETGFRKPAAEAFHAVTDLASRLLVERGDTQTPQPIFIADGGSKDPDRVDADGGPYTELQGARDAEFDSVLQVDHFHEVQGELVFERRNAHWPEILSFHDVPSALFALNSRP